MSRLSIKTRLTVVLFLSFMVLMVVTNLLVTYWDLKEIRKQSYNTARNVVAMLSQDLVRLVEKIPDAASESNADTAANVAAKLESFKAIRQMTIYNREGKKELSYIHYLDTSLPPVIERGKTFIAKGKYIHFYLPIMYHDNNFGYTYLRVSAEVFNDRLDHYFKKFSYIIPLLLLLSFVLAILIQKFFLGPINQLAGAIENVSETADYSVRVTTPDEGEIGKLFDGFNQMLKRTQIAQRQLYTEKDKLLVTFESIAEGIITTEESGRIDYINPVASQLTGWSDKDAYMQPLDNVLRLTDESNHAPLVGQIDECLVRGTTRYNIERVLLISRNKQEIPVHNSIAPIRDSEGNIKGIVAVVRNVTEARELAKLLEHQASHDALTDLANRSAFELELKKEIDALKFNEHHALLYLDLDQFKIVNDTCGHAAGDAMLQQIAGIIRHAIRDADLVARLGGDEFGVLLPHCSINQAQEVANKLLSTISSYSFSWEGKIFKTGASIGVVPIESSAMSHSDAMRHADIACYAAKNLGRNRTHLYEPSDIELTRMHGEMQWITRIENALKDNQMHLFVQQIENLDNKDELMRFEVLLRMIGKDGVVNFPGSFLPAAERYGLMPRIDRWVISNVLNDKYLINYLKKHETEISINISWATLNDLDLLDYIRTILAKSPIPATSICFEITETAAIANVPATLKFMRNMKLLGCKFALDDFGSGLSSFAYLKNLPVDYLKIDGSFIRDITTDTTNYAMVESIDHIGKVMGIKTVAEYVFDKSTYKKLKQIGVDFVQGYYVHTPMPTSDLELLDTVETLAQAKKEINPNLI